MMDLLQVESCQLMLKGRFNAIAIAETLDLNIVVDVSGGIPRLWSRRHTKRRYTKASLFN